MKKLLLIMAMLCAVIRTTEYWYPVGAHKEIIYFIYQKNLGTLQLWAFNSLTGQCELALQNGIFPALFSINENHGFSFVDQNILKFKSFLKRSPVAIFLEKPLRFMSKLTWIDKKKGYLSARLRNSFGIFLVYMDGCVETLVYDEKSDSLYPVLVGEELFFVRRVLGCDNLFSYFIVESEYRNSVVENFKIIYENSNIPILFFCMTNENEGFYVEYEHDLADQTLVCFSYVFVKRSNPYWLKEKLFSFIIPFCLIKGNESDRLYESIIPFLPKIYNNLIFFSSYRVDSAQGAAGVDLMVFNRETKTVRAFTKAYDLQCRYFAPLIHHNNVWYGHSLVGSNTDQLTLHQDLSSL